MAELSPLRRRMIEDMTVRNMSPATQHPTSARFRSSAGILANRPTDWIRGRPRLQVHLVSTGISWPISTRLFALCASSTASHSAKPRFPSDHLQRTGAPRLFLQVVNLEPALLGRTGEPARNPFLHLR
jgi:hypothetical protein